MQWYRTAKGKQRLRKEAEQMKRHAPDFSLFMDDETGRLVWVGRLFDREVRLAYGEHHPYGEIKVYVKPELPDDSHHVFFDGRICYIDPDEWHPEWTALAVLLTTIRFLDDHQHGRLDK